MKKALSNVVHCLGDQEVCLPLLYLVNYIDFSLIELNRLIKKLNSRLKNPQMSDYLEDSSIPPPSHLKCPEWAVASSAVINDRTSSPSSSVASTSPNNSTTDPLLTQPPELPRNEFPNDLIHEDSLSDTDDSDYYNE